MPQQEEAVRPPASFKDEVYAGIGPFEVFWSVFGPAVAGGEECLHAILKKDYSIDKFLAYISEKADEKADKIEKKEYETEERKRRYRMDDMLFEKAKLENETGVLGYYKALEDFVKPRKSGKPRKQARKNTTATLPKGDIYNQCNVSYSYSQNFSPSIKDSA